MRTTINRQKIPFKPPSLWHLTSTHFDCRTPRSWISTRSPVALSAGDDQQRTPRRQGASNLPAVQQSSSQSLSDPHPSSELEDPYAEAEPRVVVELGRLQDGLETVVGRLLWTEDDVGIEAGLLWWGSPPLTTWHLLPTSGSLQTSPH
jgi:hypothetical protein